jgi:hypothetical protein
MTDALQHHWLEYVMEDICLDLFTIAAFACGTIFEPRRQPGAIDTDKAPLLWDSWDFDGSIVPSKGMKFA